MLCVVVLSVCEISTPHGRDNIVNGNGTILFMQEGTVADYLHTSVPRVQYNTLILSPL